jgi:hypothetical protein
MTATVSSITQSAIATGFYITVVTPKGSTTKKIEGDLLSVGRASDCNLSIEHGTLSRRHMSVMLKNGQCMVEDHGSSNGTFVNGKRLKPHTATRVLPEDFIHLGQSGVRLSVSIEPQMFKGSTPPLPAEKDEPMADTIVTTTITQRKLKAIAEKLPEPKKSDEAAAQAEKLVQEAQKKVATLIQEAEIEAERRVQDIYRRAHETQAKMDEVYQRKMNEAYRSAEKMFQKSQADSEAILDQARSKSTEIRNQAESFVMELRRRTEEDCERILQEAQSTARELKENRLLEAEEMLRKKEEELVKSARDAMTTRLARFEEDLLKEAGRQRELLEAELRDRRNQLEEDHKDQIEAIKALKEEVKQLAQTRDKEQGKVKDLEMTSAKLEETKKTIKECNDNILQLNGEIEKLSKAREESKASLAKLKQAQAGVDAEMLKLRSKFEEDKARLQKEEQKHLEELKLQTARKVRVLEEELVKELQEKRERLSREISLNVETLMKEKGSKLSAKQLTEAMDELLNAQIVTLSNDPTAKTKQASLIGLRRREKFKTLFLGLMVGAAVALGGQRGYRIVKANQAPMKAKVQQAEEARKLDLEKRKFSPMQTKDLKPTYMDAVVYTEGYSQTYLSEDFQKKFLGALTPYMLKTWRLEEDKVIELLATSATLVRALVDKKEAIHPDFIPQGLDKMKELETESLTKMRQILGSQVRVESYRKFERKFYEDYVDGKVK